MDITFNGGGRGPRDDDRNKDVIHFADEDHDGRDVSAWLAAGPGPLNCNESPLALWTIYLRTARACQVLI